MGGLIDEVLARVDESREDIGALALRLGNTYGGLSGMIIGEMSIQLAGLGGLVQRYAGAFQTGKLLAVIMCTSLFGVVTVGVLHLVQARFFPWVAATSGERR